MGYKYLLSFRKGWSALNYAKGGLKVASRHLSQALLEFKFLWALKSSVAEFNPEYEDDSEQVRLMTPVLLFSCAMQSRTCKCIKITCWFLTGFSWAPSVCLYQGEDGRWDTTWHFQLTVLYMPCPELWVQTAVCPHLLQVSADYYKLTSLLEYVVVLQWCYTL